MKNKLELKHIAPYLPYDLRIKGGTMTYTLTGSYLDEWFNWGFMTEHQPILRPLSDLTKEIEHNGEIICPCEILFTDYSQNDGATCGDQAELLIDLNLDMILSYFEWQKLFEWHFDVFGLIEKGLAIDINTLTK